MQQQCAVEGFIDAAEREQTLRDLIYLECPYDLCGLEVRNLTPRLYALLKGTRTPLLFGGEIGIEHIEQFLCVLETPRDGETKEVQRLRVLEHCAELDLQKCGDEVFEYLQVTFADMPKGNPEAPIASGIAWIEYSFACEPFCIRPFSPEWERMMDTPLRRLYQLMRCDLKSKGITSLNESAKLESDFLDKVNAALAAGEITEAEVEEFSNRSRFTPLQLEILRRTNEDNARKAREAEDAQRRLEQAAIDAARQNQAQPGGKN